jgi:peptide deformylase
MELIESEKIENIVCEDVRENEVEEILNDKIPNIIKLIKEFNKNKEYFCVGLAAPQVGDFRKYFVRFKNNTYFVFFNAWYINNNSSRMQSKEGCFSYDLGKRINNIRRWKKIILFCDEWQEKEKVFLRKKKLKLSGEDAIVIQHETDHLYGRTIFNQ